MIILNEKVEAEKILDKGIVSKKPSETINLLVRYYKHEFNYRTKQIYSLVNLFLIKNYKNYDEVFWQDTIYKYISKAKKYPLVKVDKIVITEKEMNVIRSLSKFKYQKIMFVLLCHAKFYNLKNPNNNNWTNISYSEIYKQARVSETITNQCLVIKELKELGLLEYSKKVNNLNLRITFINEEESSSCLEITDFRELGYQYLLYVNTHGYSNCKKCGVVIKQNKQNNILYCDECKKYQPIGNKEVVCIDCKETFLVSADNKRSTRCPSCYKIYRNNYKRLKKKCNT